MSRLLIHESPLQVLPSLAQKIGLNEAIILQQIHYWLNPDHNTNYVKGRHWVYNSYQEWQQQFPFWSPTTIKRAIYSLEQQNLILTQQLSDKKFDQRKWYAINYDTLQKLEEANDQSGHFDPIEEVKMIPSEGSKCDNPYKELRIPSEITAETGSEAHAPVCQQMIDSWNQTFSELPPVQLTVSRTLKLISVLSTYFERDLVRWQAFCHTIQASSFLQGKGPRGWRAPLDWCLEDANIIKILEGNYQDSDPLTIKSPSFEASAQKALAHLESLGDIKHQYFSQALINIIGPSLYVSWFQGMRLIEWQKNTLILSFPTQFIRTYIDTHYATALLSAAQSLTPDIKHLKLEIHQDDASPVSTPDACPFEAAPQHSSLQGLHVSASRLLSEDPDKEGDPGVYFSWRGSKESNETQEKTEQ